MAALPDEAKDKLIAELAAGLAEAESDIRALMKQVAALLKDASAPAPSPGPATA